MKKIITTIILILIILIGFSMKSSAKTEIILNSSNNNIQKNEEITITANISNTDIAAYTLWIYFDSEKMECTSKLDNMNIIGNKIIYTWFSNLGKNEKINELLKINFKSKQAGIALFYVIGEIYNEKGEKTDIKYSKLEVGVGENKKNNIKQEEKLNVSSTNDDDASLEIMRVNREGIEPNFDKKAREYYLIVDENVNKLDITAIASNNEADVKIIGNDNLKKGLNRVKILVTSKNKKNKEEYVINVTKTSNQKSSDANLEILAVEYFEIIPEFDKNIINYSTEITNEVDKINILAISSDESAKVQIIGNENLKVGDNQITIDVTARDGITNKKYYLNVHKISKEEEILKKEEQQNVIKEANALLEQMNNENNKIENIENYAENNYISVIDWIIALIGSLVAIIILVVVIIRIKAR